MEEPEGALFIECHILFAEPKGWFGGTNQLVAKMPLVVQNQVRNTRTELMRASQANR